MDKPTMKKSFTCPCGKKCRMAYAELAEITLVGMVPMCAKCDDRRLMDENTRLAMEQVNS